MRANAFAIHLLAPKHLSEEVWTRVRGDIRGVMLAFGISFEAARAHLANYSLLPLGERITGVPTSPSGEWKTAESSDLWCVAFELYLGALAA